MLPSAFIRKVQILDESKLLIKKFEPQDATNFVLTYFTMAVLKKISLHKENLHFLWLTVPILSLFQILRKPDSFKVRILLEGHKNVFHLLLIKFGHYEKATKIWNNLPLDLTLMKWTSNYVGDCFKFCGLLRKPEVYLFAVKNNKVYHVSKFMIILHNELCCKSSEFVTFFSNLARKLYFEFWDSSNY